MVVKKIALVGAAAACHRGCSTQKNIYRHKINLRHKKGFSLFPSFAIMVAVSSADVGASPKSFSMLRLAVGVSFCRGTFKVDTLDLVTPANNSTPFLFALLVERWDASSRRILFFIYAPR